MENKRWHEWAGWTDRRSRGKEWAEWPAWHSDQCQYWCRHDVFDGFGCAIQLTGEFAMDSEPEFARCEHCNARAYQVCSCGKLCCYSDACCDDCPQCTMKVCYTVGWLIKISSASTDKRRSWDGLKVRLPHV